MRDLLILGAGPAGMAAATEAARLGLSATLLEEAEGPGGQIYRAITTGGASRAALLGADYMHGATLAKDLMASPVEQIFTATVWDIAKSAEGVTLTYSRNGQAAQITGKTLLLVTGAIERPVPIPGWTLPGVMTAGAGQILLKASGILPERAVLAGSGPLLYLLAVQMARAGMPPLALVETQSTRDVLRAAPLLLPGLRGWRTLLKGLGLLAELRRHGVRRITAATDLAVLGTDHATALRFRAQGRVQEIACATVMLHQGVVPNTQATRALRLDHQWLPRQRAFAPVCDASGATSAPGIYVAGDGSGIAGAKAAADAGRLAALTIAASLGHLTEAARRAQSRAPAARLSAERALRPFLDTAYPVPEAVLRPADGTTVCRCEEITAGQIRNWGRKGAMGPNQLKAFGRPGMGPCQGRSCALTLTELLAETHGSSPAEIGLGRIRPPLKPVTLGELASLHEGDTPL